ncbi:MAG: GNAT family N-acetyltransferase [Cyclobacteriaceae bacterium]|nr:GNAT family N-acetyltransferase [Cyclobacteriaceae bacterium]
MLQFELATTEAIPTLLEMMEEFYAIDHYPFHKEKNKNNLNIFLSNPELGRLWLVKMDHEIAGYVCLAYCFSFEYGGRDAFIDEFFLRPPFRNKGIGQQTMDFLETQSSQLGVNAIHLEVEKHNEAGKKLYLKKGFTDTGRHLLNKVVMFVNG